MLTKKRVKIKGEYITLGQLLKLVGLLSNGGEAKSYLASHSVFINKGKEMRRGRKIYPKDVVETDSLIIEVDG